MLGLLARTAYEIVVECLKSGVAKRNFSIELVLPQSHVNIQECRLEEAE
jgi:hypothetical protein